MQVNNLRGVHVQRILRLYQFGLTLRNELRNFGVLREMPDIPSREEMMRMSYRELNQIESSIEDVVQ